MDPQTLRAYETNAAERCARYRLILPTELLQFAGDFFRPDQPTADIGCGSGRDVEWLNRHGFPTVGYDISPAMLAEARAAYPGIDVQLAALPGLAGLPDGAYTNVLCSSVLMHLPREHLGSAVRNLARVLRRGGRMLLSYRSGVSGSQREPDGRLFTSIPPGELASLLELAGLRVMETRHWNDSYRPEVRWFTLLAESQPPTSDNVPPGGVQR